MMADLHMYVHTYIKMKLHNKPGPVIYLLCGVTLPDPVTHYVFTRLLNFPTTNALEPDHRQDFGFNKSLSAGRLFFFFFFSFLLFPPKDRNRASSALLCHITPCSFTIKSNYI